MGATLSFIATKGAYSRARGSWGCGSGGNLNRRREDTKENVKEQSQ